MESSLQAVHDRLNGASTYVDIFGPLSGSTIEAKIKSLRSSFSKLALMVHPDHSVGNEDDAAKVFARLSTLRKNALDAIKKGTYDEALASSTPKSDRGATLHSRFGTYTLLAEPIFEGDYSFIYEATDVTGKRQFVKIAAEPTANVVLEHEVKVLKRFKDTDRVPKTGIHRFLPEISDTFLVDGKDGTRFRANVMAAHEGYLSLREVREGYPKGLNPRVAAWIWRRVLAQTLAASMIGVVHAGITPDHVLVHPITHEPIHIGWAHAVIDPRESKSRITSIVDRWRDWYPPEVFDRQIPDHRTDLYMAGKMMIYLMGGDTKRNTVPKDLPPEMKRLIRVCVAKDPNDRPDDAKAVMNSFMTAIKKHWGRKYRVLEMPQS